MADSVVYVDNNATTPVAPEVFEAMRPYLQGAYGNPSSLYKLAGEAKGAIDRAREEVAKLLGSRPDEVVFTSCGSESDNTAILSALAGASEEARLVTTRVEHAAVSNLAARLGSTVTVRFGFDEIVTDVAIDAGPLVFSAVALSNASRSRCPFVFARLLESSACARFR